MVGSGIFLTSGFLIQDTGNPWLVLMAWVLGGFLAYFGAISYGYAASLYPHAGGDYVYLKEAYSPLVAFMSGWAGLLTNFSASVAVLALATSNSILALTNDFYTGPWFRTEMLGLGFAFGYPQILGAIPIVFFSATNYLGIQKAFQVQNLFSIVKFLGFFLFVAFSLFSPLADFSRITAKGIPDFTETSNWGNLLLGVIPVSFAYLGWNMITYVAEEVKNPEKNLLNSAKLACFAVALLYVVTNIVFLASSPLESLWGNEEIGVTAFIALFGPHWSLGVTLFVVWVILGSLSAILIGGSRVYFAMARDGAFFKTFATLHPKFGSPSHSIVLQASISLLFLCFEDVKSLLYTITSAILLLSSLTSCAPLVFWKRGEYENSSIQFSPISPILYLVGNTFVLLVLFWKEPIQGMWGIGLTLTAVPMYLWFRRNK